MLGIRAAGYRCLPAAYGQPIFDYLGMRFGYDFDTDNTLDSRVLDFERHFRFIPLNFDNILDSDRSIVALTNFDSFYFIE